MPASLPASASPSQSRDPLAHHRHTTSLRHIRSFGVSCSVASDNSSICERRFSMRSSNCSGARSTRSRNSSHFFTNFFAGTASPYGLYTACENQGFAIAAGFRNAALEPKVTTKSELFRMFGSSERWTQRVTDPNRDTYRATLALTLL